MKFPTLSFYKQPGVVLLLAFSIHALSMNALATDTVIEAFATSWKYMDDGSNQGIAWREEFFDDSTWNAGIDQLGYGDADETTLVNSGPEGAHYITTYFRYSFSIPDISVYENLDLTVLYDDGVVVYFNGNEVLNENLPAGEIAYDTPANSAVENAIKTKTMAASSSFFHNGLNTIAVEIHQVNASSSDMSFALRLLGYPYYDDRGPYIQMLTPTSAIMRWQTTMASNSRVRFGLSPGNLNNSVSDSTVTHVHEIKLTGLTPATQYYYDVGSYNPGDDTSVVWSSGSDHFFKTQPVVGSTSPTRIWVIGDSGSGNQSQRDVYQGYLNYAGSTYADLWLMLGDNAYFYGTDDNYQSGFFNIYQSLMHQTVVWPTLGNHDGYGVDTNTGTGPYYDIFTLPKAAELGGFPSGTESYYSYNYGNIHFIVLDSFDIDRSPTAPMAIWLENDLNATTADWIIAYWHHPPYAKGSHDSDTVDGHDGSSTGIDSYNAMIEMRENILPILEQHGVDLVLTGHSHSYERSKFINGHYGNSSTYLDSLYAININSGDPSIGDQAYTKVYPSLPHGGTVYAVAGTATNACGGCALNHPAMYRSLGELGSMVIDVNNLALSARFINQNGVVRDAFTLQKLSIGSDQDGDGITNASDNCQQLANQDQFNSDGDTQGNVCDSDDDNDLMPDTWESTYGLNSLVNDANSDLDGDGINNLKEYFNGSNPTTKPVANDFAADGKADVLLRNLTTGDWTLAQLNGLTVLNQSSVSAFTDIDNVMVSTADFNGDGKADILTRGTASGLLPGTFHIDLVSGQNVIDSNWLTAMSIDLNDEIVSTKDFNKDGKADVLLRNKATGVWKINYMNGTAVPTTATLNATLDTCYTLQGDGDYDGNGYPDLLLRRDGCGGASYPWLIYTTDGDSTVLVSGAATGVSMNTAWSALVTDKDFNGDGKADVLIRAKSGSVQQWLLYDMNGVGAPTASGLLNAPVQSMWQFAADADFNGDGKADILIRSTDTGQWYIDLLNGRTILSSAAPSIAFNPIWTLQALDDFNGDANSDILLRNSASGQWNLNLMNGLAVPAKGTPNIAYDLNYVLQND